jgi:hypothetical protein
MMIIGTGNNTLSLDIETGRFALNGREIEAEQVKQLRDTPHDGGGSFDRLANEIEAAK